MISKMNFDSFNMIYSFIYRENDPRLEQFDFSQQTMRIKIADASSLQKFQFSVYFDSSYVLSRSLQNYSPLPYFQYFAEANFLYNRINSDDILVTEGTWDCRPRVGFPGGSQCLWIPSSNDTHGIYPYSWVENSTSD